MLSRLLRQRRRVLWLALCCGLAGSLWGAPAGVAFLSFPGRHTFGFAALVEGYLAALVGGCLAALVGGCLAALALWCAPRQRRLLDSGGLALCVLALLPIPLVAVPLFLPLAWALAHGTLYGRWWDRTGLRLGLSSRARTRLDATPEAIWRALVPGEGHPDDHLSGTLVDFDTDPGDDLTLYLRHLAPDGAVEETTVSFLEKVAPLHCAYLLERASGPLPDETEVRTRLEPAGSGATFVDLALHQRDLSPRLALARWFDDPSGDLLDSLRAQLGGGADWSMNRLPLAGHSPAPTIRWPEEWPAPPQAGARSPVGQ